MISLAEPSNHNMKQFRITSRDFRLEGDVPGLPDNYVDPDQLSQLKKLAGIDSLGIMSNHLAEQQRVKQQELEASMGKSMTMTSTEKAEYQRTNHIQPGTDAWFKLWYARPSLTGETNI